MADVKAFALYGGKGFKTPVCGDTMGSTDRTHDVSIASLGNADERDCE